MAVVEITRNTVANALEDEIDFRLADGQVADNDVVDADRQPRAFDGDLALPAVNPDAEASLQHHESGASRPGLRQAGDRVGHR